MTIFASVRAGGSSMTAAVSKRTWPVLIAVFVTFFPLAFSGETITEIIQVDPNSLNEPWRHLCLAITDAGLIIIILSSTIWLWSRNGWPTFSIWAWWLIGAGMTLVLDILTIDGQAGNPWANLAVDLGYIVSLSILLAAAVKVDPTEALRPRVRRNNRQAWKELRGALPLFIGTLAAYIGSTVWNSIFKQNARRHGCGTGGMECRGAIAIEYFAQLSQVILLLLVAVGIEAGIFRASLKDPVPRAMTITTVVILCVAEVLTISTLPLLNHGNTATDILSRWHEYLAFIVTWEASFIALSLLVWALIFRSAEEDPRD